MSKFVNLFVVKMYLLFKPVQQSKIHLILINFFLQSILQYRDPNDNLMELMIMSYACKTSCAKNIIVCLLI